MTVGIRAESPHSQGRAVGRGRGEGPAPRASSRRPRRTALGLHPAALLPGAAPAAPPPCPEQWGPGSPQACTCPGHCGPGVASPQACTFPGHCGPGVASPQACTFPGHCGAGTEMGQGWPARRPGSSAAHHGHCPLLTVSLTQFPTLAGQGPPAPNTGRTPGSGLKLGSPPCQPSSGPGQHKSSAPAPRSPREA